MRCGLGKTIEAGMILHQQLLSGGGTRIDHCSETRNTSGW